MADVTGAPVPTGSSEFDVPGDIKALADHLGDPEQFSRANAAALPASGNWAGRTLMTRDTGVLYMWNGTAWVVVGIRPHGTTPAPSFLKHGRTSITTDANGLFTVTFPVAFPNSCDRVIAVSANISVYYGGVAISGMTSTVFSGRLSINNATFDLDWIAIGR